MAQLSSTKEQVFLLNVGKYLPKSAEIKLFDLMCRGEIDSQFYFLLQQLKVRLKQNLEKHHQSNAENFMNKEEIAVAVQEIVDG